MKESVAMKNLAIMSSAYLRERKAHATALLSLSIAFLAGGLIIGLTFFGVCWLIAGICNFIFWIRQVRGNRAIAKKEAELWANVEQLMLAEQGIKNV